jgi:hypothetical protein
MRAAVTAKRVNNAGLFPRAAHIEITNESMKK